MTAFFFAKSVVSVHKPYPLATAAVGACEEVRRGEAGGTKDALCVLDEAPTVFENRRIKKRTKA